MPPKPKTPLFVNPRMKEIRFTRDEVLSKLGEDWPNPQPILSGVDANGDVLVAVHDYGPKTRPADVWRERLNTKHANQEN